MKITERKELYLAVMLFLAILTLADIAYIKNSQSHIYLQGKVFDFVGIMEYTNPADGKEIFFPIYTKR